MGIKNRFIAILSALMLCLSVCTFTSAALDLDGDGYDDETGEIISDVPAEPEYTEPEYTEPEYTEPEYTEPEYTEPEYTEPEYTEPEYTEPEYTEPITEETYNYYEEETQYYYTEETYYVGGDQSWYTVPEETAPSAPLYESDRKIDVNELSDSDWKDIAANLKNASLSDSDGDDFGFIKNNNDTSDNGQWMLILGIILLLLAAAGIAYTVISIVMSRKRLSKAYAGHSSGASRSSNRSSDDYGDGYRRTSAKKAKSKSRSSKYDTADVYVPKSSSAKRYNNSNKGSRYK